MECRRVRRSATDTAGFAAEDLRERGYVVEPLNLIVMDYSVLLQKYAPVASDSLVESVVAKARAEMDRNRNEEVYRFCFSALDLTTLSGSDSVRSVAEFVKKAVDVPVRFPGMPNVATVCVYPSFVDIAGLGVEGTNIGVTSVAGGFPAAQTYLEVKMLEVAMAVENGADEIDVVMNAGEMVEGEFDRLANDLELLCREAGQEVTFKVIVEFGHARNSGGCLSRLHAGNPFRCRFREDFDRQIGLRCHAEVGHGHLQCHQGLLFADRNQRRHQAGGRYPYRGRCRALLYHRGKYARPRVADPGRCSVSGQVLR